MPTHRGTKVCVAIALLGATAALAHWLLSPPAAPDRAVAPGTGNDPDSGHEITDAQAATWRLTGTVRSVDRVPLAGARVQIGRDTAETGPDGTFAINGLPYQAVDVTIGCAGYGLATRRATPGNVLDVRLAPIVAFTGTVSLDTGAIPAGVQVIIRKDERTSVEVTLDANGAFEVSHLPAGRYTADVAPWVDADGTPWLATTAQIDTRGTATRAVEITPARGALIEGAVWAPDGELLRGALIYAKAHRRGGREEVARTHTDAEGRFRLAVPPDLECTVLVDTPHDDTGWTYQRMYVGKIVGDGEPLEFRLEAGHGIAGRVIAPRGISVAGRWISANRIAGNSRNHVCTGRVSDDGRFELRGLWDAYYEIRVEGASGANDRFILSSGFRVKSDTRDAELRFVRPVRFAGTVTDREGGPWAHGGIIVHHATAGWSSRTSSDDEGRFAIERVPPGKLRVIILKPGRNAGSWAMGEHRADDQALLLQVDAVRSE